MTFPYDLVYRHLKGSDPAVVASRAIVRTPAPPYARRLGAEDWPRTRASVQFAMQSSRIDAMPDAELELRTRIGLKL